MVGLLERLDESVLLMEKTMPSVFNGFFSFYNEHELKSNK